MAETQNAKNVNCRILNCKKCKWLELQRELGIGFAEIKLGKVNCNKQRKQKMTWI